MSSLCHHQNHLLSLTAIHPFVVVDKLNHSPSISSQQRRTSLVFFSD
jgi:hypothetical protein